MKRVLIVSPNWPPLSFPDMHRVRMALPFFAANGWEPLILKVNPDEQMGTRDPLLERTVPAGTRVWQSGFIAKRWTRWLGLHHVGLRSLFHLARLGSRLIESEKPALAFFSTTMFPLFILGPYWKWRHRLPYVLDFQDPWVNDDRRLPSCGGSGKLRLARAMARALEPICVRNAAHLVSVSPEYTHDLRHRYDGLADDRTTVLPFGAPEHDFAVLEGLDVAPSAFDAGDGRRHWVYVGRGGADMAFALRGFFRALSRARADNPAKYANLTVNFVGTDYAPAGSGRKTVEPIAFECGVADMVVERPERIPYFEALKSLQAADAIIVPGSDDPGYTASKIYPCVLGKKPLLALFNEKSTTVDFVRSTRSGVVVTFSPGEDVAGFAQRVHTAWFEGAALQAPTTDWDAFAPYSARAMTRRLCGSFDAALDEEA